MNLITKLLGYLPPVSYDIAENVNVLITNVIDQVKDIATPIAVLAAVFCGVKLFVASDPQSVRQAKSWLITIVIGLALIYLAEPLINTAVTLLGG